MYATFIRVASPTGPFQVMASSRTTYLPYGHRAQHPCLEELAVDGRGVATIPYRHLVLLCSADKYTPELRIGFAGGRGRQRVTRPWILAGTITWARNKATAK
jgi:hypothetical protein